MDFQNQNKTLSVFEREVASLGQRLTETVRHAKRETVIERRECLNAIVDLPDKYMFCNKIYKIHVAENYPNLHMNSINIGSG